MTIAISSIDNSQIGTYLLSYVVTLPSQPTVTLYNNLEAFWVTIEADPCLSSTLILTGLAANDNYDVYLNTPISFNVDAYDTASQANSGDGYTLCGPREYILSPAWITTVDTTSATVTMAPTDVSLIDTTVTVYLNV